MASIFVGYNSLISLMKKLLVAFFTLVSVYGFAQSPVSNRISSGADLGMAYTTRNYNPSFTYYQLLNFGEKKLFSIGWTLRLGAFYGDNLNYYTAPARLTREKTGFSAIGAPLVISNIDTVRYDYVTMTSANFGVRAQIKLGPVEVGASADLLGLTIGKSRTGRIASSTGKFTRPDSTTAYFRGADVFQSSRPSRFNARLLGDNDIGTLSTEVFARIFIKQRVGIKAGYQWLVTETKIDNRDIVADNNRFRNRVGMPYLAVTLPVFN
ncbi:hypothetical protein [Spirosoma sp.]|uniref:hypothetical protein n=1 Tax=Spirosoma sp. TaxID=1899569 RepID=UPI003B3A2DB9